MDNLKEIVTTEAKELFQWLQISRSSESDRMIDLICKYIQMLIEKNKVMNLTAIRDVHDIVVRHIEDSFKCVEQIDLLQKERGEILKVVDLGSGAGLPGIIIGILCPNVQITMIESTGKKADFIQEAVDGLALSNCKIAAVRIEDFANFPGNKNSCDIITARALAELRVLCEYAMPLLKIGGTLLAMKSKSWQTELQQAENAMHVLGAKYVDSIFYTLTINDEELHRCFVFLEKLSETPFKYPRSNGIPTKKPL